MARRKAKPKRRNKSAFSISNAAQSLIIANAVSRGIAGTNLIPFLTEGWLLPKTAGDVGGAGQSWTFSAQELLMGMTTGNFGQSATWSAKPLRDAFEKNIRSHGAKSLAIVIATPIAFKIGKKVLGKTLINPTNKMLRAAGVREMKI